MKKHTPGPWDSGEEYQPGKYSLPSVVSVAAHGKVIAHVNCAWNNGDADARLIAAAPDMLAALTALYVECDAFMHEELDECPIWGPIMRAAKTAIDKATSP